MCIRDRPTGGKMLNPPLVNHDTVGATYEKVFHWFINELTALYLFNILRICHLLSLLIRSSIPQLHKTDALIRCFVFHTVRNQLCHLFKVTFVSVTQSYVKCFQTTYRSTHTSRAYLRGGPNPPPEGQKKLTNLGCFITFPVEYANVVVTIFF